MIGTLIKLFTEDFWERRKEANKLSSNVPVIGSVCDHPNRQREYYREGCYKCWKCNKIIVAN